jgi:histidinol-phosphatase
MTGDGGPEYGVEWSASLRRGSDAELRRWVTAALGWCDAADEIAMRHFRRAPEAIRKPDRTFVTEADTAIERLVRDRIAATFPVHGILGEEFGAEAAGASVRWYLDPIDGTHNFMRGVPLFATLLAAERDGELQAAVISAPALGGRWFAWRGGGAWAVGVPAASGGGGGAARGARTVDGGALPSGARRMAVSRIDELAEAQILYAGVVDLEASGRAPGFRALLRDVWRERGFGDFYGYTLVGEGAAEAMIEVDLSAWDAAAPMLLVEEAGGRATDFEGRRRFDAGTFLATNGRLHEQIRMRVISE